MDFADQAKDLVLGQSTIYELNPIPLLPYRQTAFLQTIEEIFHIRFYIKIVHSDGKFVVKSFQFSLFEIHFN